MWSHLNFEDNIFVAEHKFRFEEGKEGKLRDKLFIEHQTLLAAGHQVMSKTRCKLNESFKAHPGSITYLEASKADEINRRLYTLSKKLSVNIHVDRCS